MEWWQLAVAVAASVGSSTVIVKILDRRRTEAEATDILTQAGDRVVKMLRGELNQAHDEIRDLRKEIAHTRITHMRDKRDLEDRIRHLETRLARYETI